MLCVASLAAGLILGWVARGELVADPEAASTPGASSSGAPAVAGAVLPMPDVRGLSEADARQVLADAGYDASVVKVKKVASVAAAGTVAAQEPVSGTSNPSSITLSLPSPANMPDLKGKSLVDATQALTAMGAQPAVRRVYDAQATTGTILGTEPASGAPLTATPTLTVAGSPGSAPLSSLKDTGDCGSVSSGSVNGTAITEGVRCGATSTPAKTYWILGRSVSRLKATVGVDDSSDPSTRVRVTITADGRTLMDKGFTYGQSENLDADIGGALRLEIIVSAASTPSASSRSQSIVLGNAVVLGSTEAIAALAAKS